LGMTFVKIKVEVEYLKSLDDLRINNTGASPRDTSNTHFSSKKKKINFVLFAF
jgi:hypothetical protein